ncbi:MAG: ribosomal protein L13e [Thermoproteota archaeon]|nr:ribosomal protein L13e [Thermoproteota archaeon]
MEKGVEKPIVKIFHHGMRRIRTGRGFSKGELVQVGILNVNTAASKGIPLDKWRKTSHPENVEKLTKILSYSTTNGNKVSTATKTRSSKSTTTTEEKKKKITNKKKPEKSKKSSGIAKIIRRKSS